MSEAPRVYSKKYRPARDRARMQKYMADLREKDRAGYKSLTVVQYRNALAAMQMESIESLK